MNDAFVGPLIRIFTHTFIVYRMFIQQHVFAIIDRKDDYMIYDMIYNNELITSGTGALTSVHTIQIRYLFCIKF